MATAAAVAGAGVAAASPAVADTTNATTATYTQPGTYYVEVPQLATSTLTLDVRGASGDGDPAHMFGGGLGGAGTDATATFSVAAAGSPGGAVHSGDLLKVTVGAMGGGGPGGSSNGASDFYYSSAGYAGGASTYVWDLTRNLLLAVGGGGGGGGGLGSAHDEITNATGGDGGTDSAGSPGLTWNSDDAAGGATDTICTLSPGNNGGAGWNGQTNAGGGGGGGAGYCGGAGGQSSAHGGGGGGGGAGGSYLADGAENASISPLPLSADPQDGSVMLSWTAAVLTVDTATLPPAVIGMPYSASLSASGGTPPYEWHGTGLPPGLTLNADGTVTGTPTAAGSYILSVALGDDAATPANVQSTVGLRVVSPLAVFSTALATGTVGTVYASTLSATGGSGGYHWTASGLPPGLSMNADGTIVGTPTTAATSTVTVTVTDLDIPGISATASLPLVVQPAPLVITVPQIPTVTVGSPFSTDLSATGGTAPYSWSLTSGTLPAGLTLNTDGTITGTPTTDGFHSATVTVTDSSTPSHSASAAVEIQVDNPALAITTTSLPTATVGVPYSTTLEGTGGSAPYTWYLESGSLPSGLTLDPDGTISGTPTTAGDSTATCLIQDSVEDNLMIETTLNLTVLAA